METTELVLTFVHFELLGLILGGLVLRRLFRLCYSFALYAGTVLATEMALVIITALFGTWPWHLDFAWRAFLVKETIYGAVKFAILLEITALTYQAFPSARAAVRRLLLGAMVLVICLLTIGVPAQSDFYDFVRDLLRRLAQGMALACFATWALVLWYRLPLHRWHRAILRGLVPYTLAFAAARNLTLVFGWDVRVAVNVGDMIVYTLVLAYWAWEIWRKPPVEPDFLRTLQPWRARLERARGR